MNRDECSGMGPVAYRDASREKPPLRPYGPAIPRLSQVRAKIEAGCVWQ